MSKSPFDERAAPGVARWSLLVLVTALALTTGCSSGRDVRPSVESGAATRKAHPHHDTRERTGDDVRDEIVHVVIQGETLYGIAKRYGVTVADLAAANGIANPAKIAAGRRLVIPDTERDDLGRSGWIWPVRGRVSSLFGAPRSGRTHRGIDILVPRGTPVVASHEGRVRFAGVLSGYGRLVVVEHEGELASWYAHNRSLSVREGDRVDRGDAIAESGASGNATAPHVHFEIREKERPLDPLSFLPPS